MANSSAVSLSPADEKQLNKGRKRTINISEWAKNKRKSSMDSG